MRSGDASTTPLATSRDCSSMKASTQCPRAALPRLSESGRPQVGSELVPHDSFGGRAEARLTTRRTHELNLTPEGGSRSVGSNRKRRAYPVAGL